MRVRARPAFDRDKAVLGVDADRDAAGIEPRRLAHEGRIAHRRRADDDARDALVEPAATACACRECRRRAAPESSSRRGWPRPPRAFIGAPAKAPSRSTTCRYSKPCRSKARACAAGIVVEDGRRGHVALREAHALAILQVDRGKQDHGRHLRKLPMSARPSLWLFSGWNCVPTRLSRADDGGERRAIVGRREHMLAATPASS